MLCDLDATLINSLSIREELPLAPKEFQAKFSSHIMTGHYVVFERPYLQEFLDYLFATFDVSVFTAADKDYALFVADNIILQGRPERKLQYLFYGTHSAYSEGYYHSPKDLRLLWEVFQLPGFTPCNSVILDDLADVYEANPTRTIRAPKFELVSDDKKLRPEVEHDTFLLQAVGELERRRKEFVKSPCAHQFGRSHTHECTSGGCRTAGVSFF